MHVWSVNSIWMNGLMRINEIHKKWAASMDIHNIYSVIALLFANSCTLMIHKLETYLDFSYENQITH